MKHPQQRQTLILQLADRASQLELPLSETQVSRMVDHLLAVLDANKHVNLTAITDPVEALDLHVVDSLLGVEALESALPGRAVDIGTGAGFPGLPLSIATGREFVLLEATRKKAGLVRGFAEKSGAPVRVAAVRAEELALEEAASFSAVTARAVAPLVSLLELASPLLAPGGRLLAYKAKPDDAEVEAALRAEESTGMGLLGVERKSIPSAGGPRSIYVFARSKEAPAIRLPRRPGRAQRKPLG